MSTTTTQLREMIRVLKDHEQWILADYQKAKDNYSQEYLRLAMYLRLLLADRTRAVLLRFAKAIGKTLYAYVSDEDLSRLDGEAVWAWSGFVLSWTPEPGTHRITIEKFLDRPIGVYSDHAGIAHTYTPRQLIKDTANREGVAHLAFKKGRRLQQLKLARLVGPNGVSGSFEVRHGICAITGWTYNAIQDVLNECPLTNDTVSVH
jgi:hypothetical protein